MYLVLLYVIPVGRQGGMGRDPSPPPPYTLRVATADFAHFSDLLEFRISKHRNHISTQHLQQLEVLENTHRTYSTTQHTSFLN